MKMFLPAASGVASVAMVRTVDWYGGACGASVGRFLILWAVAAALFGIHVASASIRKERM